MKLHTLSKTAERIYWLGRYLERAECTARLINVNAMLMIDLPRGLSLGWRPLVDITGNVALFDALYDEASERNVVRFLTSDPRNGGSLLSSLHSARENARTVREIMPRVSFEYVNDLYLATKQGLSGTPSRARRGDMLGDIMRRTQQIDGLLSGSMLHDANWSFLRLGHFLERADMTSRIVDVRATTVLTTPELLEPYRQVQWRSILRSLHAWQNYQISVQEPLQQALALDFLLHNEDLPRSLRYCIEGIRRSLRRLPRNAKPLARCNLIVRRLAEIDANRLSDDALHVFIDEWQLMLAELHDLIGDTYFHARLRVRRRTDDAVQVQTQTQAETEREPATANIR
jgi:uncharacterized alpha-E superfamily protein